jgi:hypothetical protein
MFGEHDLERPELRFLFLGWLGDPPQPDFFPPGSRALFADLNTLFLAVLSSMPLTIRPFESFPPSIKSQ